MFIGHFAVGFGAKKAAPKTSLGTLFLAAQFVDLLWPTMLLFGLEQVKISPGITRLVPLDFVNYPITHSLLAALLWGTGFGLVYWIARKYPVGAVVVGAAVVSHWLLDLLTHRPDLPLYPGGSKVGLGLWNLPAAAILVETVLFVAGVVLYFKTTTAKDNIGRNSLWVLVAFLGITHFANVYGPPPPSVAAIAWTGQSMWLLVLWGYWVDRHRTTANK